MKLRILGDTLRLRLSQSDVQTLLEQGRIEDATHFAPGRALVYAVERAEGSAVGIAAELDGTRVVVRVPESTIKSWGESDQVSLSAEQLVEQGRTLALLIEKDFKCAVPRAGEEDYDGFPHPDVSC